MEVTLSARAQFTLPAHFGKIKQSHTELIFLFLLRSFFCLSLVLSLLVLFLLCICETQRKTSKMFVNLHVFELFLIQCSGWRNWPEMKFHLLSNARERAHESVNGPLTTERQLSCPSCKCRVTQKLRNSSVVYYKTKNPLGAKTCMTISFQLLLHIKKVKSQDD